MISIGSKPSRMIYQHLTSKETGCLCVLASPFLKEQKPFERKELTMTIHESAEDYLEQILMIMERKGYVRSIDIAAGLNVTKPSVSVAMRKLRESGYINMGSNNLISLTDKGYTIARKIYDRHRTLTKYLIQLGVPDEIARADACKIEHDLSDESFEAIRGQVKL